jgi:hypothetical protein
MTKREQVDKICDDALDELKATSLLFSVMEYFGGHWSHRGFANLLRKEYKLSKTEAAYFGRQFTKLVKEYREKSL